LEDGEQAITCRPADLLKPEVDALSQEFDELVAQHNLTVKTGEAYIDDVLSYALFPQVGLNFIKNRGDASAFEPKPTGKSIAPSDENGDEIYTVEVEGQSYTVTVTAGGDLSGIVALADVTEGEAASASQPSTTNGGGTAVNAPLAGNVISIPVTIGQQVEAGQTVLVLEAMKMETNVSAAQSGTISAIKVREGDSVSVGDDLLSIA